MLRRSGGSGPGRAPPHATPTSSSTRTPGTSGGPADLVELTPTEYKLLHYLLANARRVLTRDQILEHVWDYTFAGNASVLETYISYLRHKIDEVGATAHPHRPGRGLQPAPPAGTRCRLSDLGGNSEALTVERRRLVAHAGRVSLRLRLVLGLVLLLVLGLGAFGVATYTWYSPTQYQRLDDQLAASLPFVSVQLLQKAGIAYTQPGGGPGGGPGPGDHGNGGGSGPGGGQGPGNPNVPINAPIPPGTFAELLGSHGQVLSKIAYLTSSKAAPKLPAGFGSVGTHGRLFTTGSVVGSTTWQVLVRSAAPNLVGGFVVVAIPTGGVSGALHRLLLIEAAVALGLLAVLSAGSWLLLRRGLRPLEEMATAARSIAAGDLSQRVGPEGGPSEVAELGRALNTMLSDIENAFAERAETEQRLRRFLADASHELRTPLTSIQGFAELFRIGVDSEHVDQATIARRIEDEAARMRTLVEDLLLLARLDLAPEPQQEPVDLAVLAADACSDAVAMAPDRPVTLDAPEPVEVFGDANHLRQAVANLIANAVRHTPAGSPIDVAASRDGTMGVVQVRDHGPGLDADALAHAFDRFWQADSARSGEGAGLGLSIVAAVAGEHGGTVEAFNVQANGDGPGDHDHGAVFQIRVPAERPPGWASGRRPAPMKSVGFPSRVPGNTEGSAAS